MSAADLDSSTLGLGQVPMMFVAPGKVFGRIAVDGRYGWALAMLILLITLIGWVTVQTGLIDLRVNQGTQRALQEMEREQIDLLSRVELSERLDKIRKQGEFTKLMKRGMVMLAAPVILVASLALIAALLFAVVALAGNKPDYPTLMAVCVYSAVVDVLAAGLGLAMMLYYRTIEVDTSLASLVSTSEQTRTLKAMLSAVDPFRVWFWLLVALGLVLTGQLSRRAAVTSCVVFCLAAVGMHLIPAMAGLRGG